MLSRRFANPIQQIKTPALSRSRHPPLTRCCSVLTGASINVGITAAGQPDERTDAAAR
ncbi:hypothetical protein [Escherichia coli]|uniref:hypothetical protein n=1 Tax=Escherichia coli TaxID=562 RepID=UPI00157B1A96|nr:hypothetical protein [Escherichia coli]